MRSDFALLSHQTYVDWRDSDPHEFLTRYSGAPGEAREPESISAAGGSGSRRVRGSAGMTT
jgi:hypothetical protein